MITQQWACLQLTWLYLCAVVILLKLDWTMGTVPVIQSLADPRNLATLATFLGLTLLMQFTCIVLDMLQWLENHIHGIVHS